MDVRPYDACRLVTLSGLAPPFLGVERRLLEPFDTIGPIDQPQAPRLVSARRWVTACRAFLAADTPPGSLRCGRTAQIELLAHQLEPVLAVLAGRGSRVLLADEVGLGKTIQAGLILAELLDRGSIERVLVITPAGLRDQWTHELSDRFGLAVTSADGRALRRLAAALPIGMNPWSAIAIGVVSTDYLKRPEVLPALASCRWDAIVVDEAHGAAGDSDRRAAVHALATRASYVVLLTATPHSGDRAAFTSLCGLGAVDGDPLLVFRRRRADVRADSCRRVRTIRIHPSAAEVAMHAHLERYAQAVRAERGSGIDLALSVLHKRAFSSPWSLLQSVARRVSALEEPQDGTGALQMALPLCDADGEQTLEDEAPEWPSDLALGDRATDRRLLETLLEACRTASASERKIAALRRWLSRVRESAIVFTEYRDTLLHVRRAIGGLVRVAVLHGGMTRDERSAAIAAFEQGERTVLLATDAAGEGLNLQRRCRIVVNLELPWTPTRLEQRIGRVDRIGQSRTVHALHLVADRTGELEILDRLRRRVARAREDIGASDPIGGSDDDRPAQSPSSENGLVFPDFTREACAEVDRLRRARVIARERVGEPCGTAYSGPLVVWGSRNRLRPALGARALLVWRLSWDTAAGSAVESTLVAVTVAGVPRSCSRDGARSIVRSLAAAVAPNVAALAAGWFDRSAETVRARVAVRLARERTILAALPGDSRDRFQPGLFDGRAERRHHLEREQAAELIREIVDRITLVERASALSSGSPTLLLAALP